MLEGRAELLVVEDLAVVVEADPGRRGEAVPFVQREPDGVTERNEDERGVDGERGEDVEVADPARRARCLDAARGAPRETARPPQREGCGGRFRALVVETTQLLWNFE